MATSTRKRNPDGTFTKGAGEVDLELALGRPLLVSGAAGPDVHDLCRMLAQLGHETTCSRGENAFGVVDESVIAAVNVARDQLDVDDEPPTGYDQRTTIGPATWAALIAATR